MAHRHNEQGGIAAVHAEFDLRDERQHGAAAMIAYRALWVASCAGRVHQHPRVFRRHHNVRVAGARVGDQLLIGSVPGRALTCSKPDAARRLHREFRSDLLHRSDKLVLDDDGGGLGVIYNVADLLADEAEVQWHRDQPGFGGSGINLDPFDRIVSQDCNAVAFGQSQSEKSVGKLAGARVPLVKCHAAFEVARARPLRKKARVRR